MVVAGLAWFLHRTKKHGKIKFNEIVILMVASNFNQGNYEDQLCIA